MIFDKKINERFKGFLQDWNYTTYLLLGGYGSSKSYHIVCKLVAKCYEEKRKVLVVRRTLSSIADSCFDLFVEILTDMNLVGRRRNQVRIKKTPMMIDFPNGSRVIFKGMDDNLKIKSINGVSIVWLEEASELFYSNFKELMFRLRVPELKLHFILSTNPVDKSNWIYTHFFIRKDKDDKEVVILDDEVLYVKRTIVKNGVYYHHSLPDDNQFLPKDYITRLDETAEFDPDLHRIARFGRFGVNGVRVLPQFVKASSHGSVMAIVATISDKHKYNGIDFGFEVSYNCVIRCAVDHKEKVLYIYDEYYKNKMTDDKTADELIELGWQDIPITADCEDPKAINYYQQRGFKMRKCKKWAGSRLYNTRKCKRFRKIVCSPNCKNTIKELQNLTYKVDKNGAVIYDEFNIDPHSFSAIWYALDLVEVTDIKNKTNNSWRGDRK